MFNENDNSTLYHQGFKKAKCDIFIDDLESILKLIPDKLFKIKYGSKSSYYKYSLKWENIPKIINEEF